MATPDALQLLRTQPDHYAIIFLLGRRYLVSKSDVLTIPTLNDVKVGDLIQFTRVIEVGSRDYTLRLPDDASGLLNDQTPRIHHSQEKGLEHVTATGVVLEHTKGKMMTIEKFKRRKGYKRTLYHKHGYTRIRIRDIII